MRHSFVAMVERNREFTESFATEPYEVAWAGECICFVQLFEASGSSFKLFVQPQISPDGIHWCDKADSGLLIESPGLYPIVIREFGHWLRMNCRVEGDNPRLKVTISLVLKE